MPQLSRLREKTMKIVQITISIVVCLTSCELCVAQNVLDPRHNFHAGIHSGSATLKRSQILEAESQDPHRLCLDPYCARCAKHLADYGHEYQYLAGPHQRQIWYRGTAGNIAVVTQRGYDQHGLPYRLRGNPASAIISWEYMQTLNHAIWEQVNARNAVAAEEAAHDRVILLANLLQDATEQLRLTKEAWEELEPQLEPMSKPCNKIVNGKIVGPRCIKTYKQFCIEMKAGRYEVARQGMCPYCLAHARYLFDQAYVADVTQELAKARHNLAIKEAVATEAVRIASLSKDDADRATRFARVQYKPPKYQEILAAMNATNANFEDGEQIEEFAP